VKSESSPSPKSRADVVVIGAGAVGAATARAFAVAGASVVVLDKAPHIGGGCSYANAGILAPDHVGPLATPALLREAPAQMLRRPPAVRVRPARGLGGWLAGLTASAAPRRSNPATARLQYLAHVSTQLHIDLAAQGLNPTLRKSGALDVYLKQPRGAKANAALTAAELRSIEPALTQAVAGFKKNDEWTLESRTFVKSMLDDARQHGAEVRYSTEVQRFGRDQHGRIHTVDTDQGTVATGHVVLAGGLESTELSAQLGLNLPIRGGRGYVIDIAAPPEALRIPVRLKEHRVVVTPLPDRVRVCGSIEFGNESRSADLARADRLLAVAAEAIPTLLDYPVMDRWAGERPCTRDGVPFIGATAASPNVSIAAGHGMWGLILAPITGDLLSDQALEGIQAPALEWLDPDRFTPHLRNRDVKRVS